VVEYFSFLKGKNITECDLNLLYSLYLHKIVITPKILVQTIQKGLKSLEFYEYYCECENLEFLSELMTLLYCKKMIDKFESYIEKFTNKYSQLYEEYIYEGKRYKCRKENPNAQTVLSLILFIFGFWDTKNTQYQSTKYYKLIQETFIKKGIDTYLLRIEPKCVIIYLEVYPEKRELVIQKLNGYNDVFYSLLSHKYPKDWIPLMYRKLRLGSDHREVIHSLGYILKEIIEDEYYKDIDLDLSSEEENPDFFIWLQLVFIRVCDGIAFEMREKYKNIILGKVKNSKIYKSIEDIFA
jgi:hypothetical protein